MALDRFEYIAYRRRPGLIDAQRVLAGGGAKQRCEFTTGAGGGQGNGNEGSLWRKGSLCVCLRVFLGFPPTR